MIGIFESGDVLSTEHHRERLDGEKITGAQGDPATAIGGEHAGGDEAMEMHMIAQRLVPCMQQCEKAQDAALVAGKQQKRLFHDAEQDGVDHLLVPQSESAQLVGGSKDRVRVGHREDLSSAGLL
jgi:hypothetical protein